MKKDVYELTNPQKSIWVTEQYYKNTAVNNICGYVYISDNADLKILEKAINELVKNNDGMRLQIDTTSQNPVQFVEKYSYFDIDIIDLPSSKDIEKEALRMASIPFTDADKYLFKFVLFRLPDGAGGFIVNVHHIIGDSWSLGLIAKESTAIYSNLLTGTYEEKAFPSYLGYIDAENAYKGSDKWLKDKAYWQDVFNTVPEVASFLPKKSAKSNSDISCVGNRKRFSFSKKDLAKVKKFCDTYKVSIYNFFMAVYSLYLSRINNLDDFVVGTPILNRTSFDQKHTMGMFISVAPLRVSLDSEGAFVDFVKNISSQTMSVFRHQKYSYQSILEDLRQKDSSIPNLYNVIVSYQITKTIEESSDVHYSTDWVFNGNCADELQIHLFDINDENALSIAYDYKADLFDESEIKKFHKRILCIIDQIIENENILMNDIEIVTAEEKKQILTDFNDTYMDYPRDKTIVDLFEEQVKKTPDNVAVVFENEKLTYRELNERSNQLARYLISNGIQLGDIVGIYLDKSLEIIVAMFAILKSGATFLPLDIEYPDDRLNYILSHSKPKAILTSDKITSKFDIPTFSIDLSSSIYHSKKCDNLNLDISPEDLMYIMYTSGSTGNPKGVMVKHANIIRLAAFPNFIKFSKNEVMVQTGTIVFDACIFEIFGAILHGFKLYILRKENILNIPYFSKFLKDNKVTILFLTTGLFNQLGLQAPSMFSDLKYLLTGGDVISKESINNILKISPNLQIINCYGPTENGSYSTVYPVSGKESNIPIGKPITNSTAYVVSHGQLCPIGIPGELFVGGLGVARGYLNNASLTKKQFINNPFGTGIVYKTGDLVKWLPDGNIKFIERIDNQVKVRGFRIELSEIDKQILSDVTIKQSLTLIKKINDAKILCSYIVSDKDINVAKLKTFLAKSLPVYMIPSFIVQLPSFPLNINGKVDVKSLPAPNLDKGNRKIVTARNATDEATIHIWENLLNVTNISIKDSFFDLGGDSLSAISFATLVSKELSSNITVSDIFKHPILEEISDYISFNHSVVTENIVPAPKSKYYPASSAQKRIYYSSNIEQNSVLYNISGGIVVDQVLDFDLLEKSFKILINRHNMLRTHFEMRNNELVQIVDEKSNFKLAKVSLNKADMNACFSSFVKPFDLSKAPLFRAQVAYLDNKKTFLMIDLHHIICDGTSLNIFLRELCDLYNGETLSEKVLEYTDFSVWEHTQSSNGMKEHKDFWINQYSSTEIPLLNIPTKGLRSSIRSFEGSNYYQILPNELAKKINEVAKQLEVTPYMLMLSVFYILLSKYTGQDDIIVGTPVSGRSVPELTDMFGMFVNTLPLRNTIDASLKFKDFATQIKEYCLSAFQHQIYPFDELVKTLNIPRDSSRNPLFDVMFIYQNTGYPQMNFKDASVEYFIPDSNISKFDLSLEIVPKDEALSLRFEYCNQLFDSDFIENLAIHYINILNIILENTNAKISDIDMLSDSERNQILYDFNNTFMDYPHDKTIINLFEEQAKKTPNNIALVFEDEKLTYKQLNEKANQLAHYLIENGISNNDIVGIMLPRSLDIIISILAVLKAGAAYLPIDPDYPVSRIAYILKNSGAKLLISFSKECTSLSFSGTLVCLDFLRNIIDKNSTKNPDVLINNDDLSYVIYTSGSTGQPKGVKLKHLSLSNLTHYCNEVVEYLKNNKYRSIVSITTISFDIFIFETLIALQRGLKLVIANRDEQSIPSQLDNLIKKEHIEIIQSTPSRMLFFCDNIDSMPHFNYLKFITLAGEQLSINLVNKLKDSTNCVIYNGYGPSETTVFSTLTDVTNMKRITIGRPLANTQIYILNSNNQLCPTNIPGEICISGDGVGHGYIGHNDLNKKSFVTNPFIDNSIMYKTGDLGYYNSNGEIICLGRLDHQIKIRGLRIELGEIEHTLLTYPNVSDCVVSAIDSNTKLCAYYVSKSEIPTSDLRNFLNYCLPSYMIPNFFVRLDSLPYTPNGKVDRKKLPIPNLSVLNNESQSIFPKNDLEQKILNAFKKVLNIDSIGINDNFFDLGGDSLLAMSLLVELVKISKSFTYSDIFIYTTVAELALKLENSQLLGNNIYSDSDFSDINNVLSHTNDIHSKVKKTKLSNILLTGVTGFLGIHILAECLECSTTSKIYCLIREKNNLSAEERLLNKLHFYFGDKYDTLINKRIILVSGDISQEDLGLSDSEKQELARNVTTVINSAAKVAHYGNYSFFKNINILGTKNIVDFCHTFNKKLYHVSTLSISGNGFSSGDYMKQDLTDDIIFRENNLFIGQSLENVYVRSKFEAEKIVLSSINDGLDAYILRIGNLMPRFSDNKFQDNENTNAYANRIITFMNLQCIPHFLASDFTEFTPVDYCAKAIVKLVENPSDNNRIFHLYNHNYISISELLSICDNIKHISVLSDEMFKLKINKLINSPNADKVLFGILSDFDSNGDLMYGSKIKLNSDFTVNYLKNLNFEWPLLTKKYLLTFLKNLLKEDFNNDY